MKTNLDGYFYMSRAAVADMEAGGSIIMTGSVTAIEGSKELLDYSIPKGASRVRALALRAADRHDAFQFDTPPSLSDVPYYEPYPPITGSISPVM